MPSTRRRRLPLFLVSMWLPVALRWSTLPFRVTRKRLAVARWVFVFGIPDLPFVRCGGRIRRGGDGRYHLLPRLACPFLRECLEMPLVGADHHDHVAPLLLRHRFNDDQFAEV